MRRILAKVCVLGLFVALGWGEAGLGQSVGPLVMPDVVVEASSSPEPPLRVAESSGAPPMAALRPAAEGARDQLEAIAAWNRAGSLPARTGIVRALPGASKVFLTPVPKSASPRHEAGGLLAASPAGGVVWGARVEVEGARRLRLHLTGVALPEGSRLWVYGEGEEPRAFGLDLLGPDGDLWTPSAGGEAIYLEVEVPAGAGAGPAPGFAVPEVLESLAAEEKALPPFASCLVDGSCISTGTLDVIDVYRRAVAQLRFVDGGYEGLCSGALLADAGRTATPYLLTAHHCFSKQAVASTLEAFWDYRTPSCHGSSPGLSKLPRSNGAKLLASRTVSDFTFVRLNDLPPGRVFLGWNASSSAVADGTVLHRLSHPAPFFPDSYAAAQTYSRSVARSSAVPTCIGARRPNFIYAQMSDGGTFAGSSGAPVLTAGGIVVGQLSGGCGPDPFDGCNYGNSEFDGAFAVTYPFIAQWLGATAEPEPCVADDDTLCLNGGRFRVEVAWRTPQGAAGRGRAVRMTADTGYFWFFNQENVETVVKVIDGCGVDAHYWVFAGGLTNVRAEITVTDSRTGVPRTYVNPQSTAFQPIQDTAAFACP